MAHITMTYYGDILQASNSRKNGDMLYYRDILQA